MKHNSVEQNFRRLLSRVQAKKNLSVADATVVFFDIILDGRVNPLLIAAMLSALSTKGEHQNEILAGVNMLAPQINKASLPYSISSKIIDTCGTGGDNSNTFNISTTVAIVAAACGVPVAKHGNRSATSNSGSADVLEALGVNLTDKKQARSLNVANIGFFYAPNYYPRLSKVSDIRKELGVKTIFNLLGPLLNPMGVKRQLIGVYDASLIDVFCSVLSSLGHEKFMVVNGEVEGAKLDELALSSKNTVRLISKNEDTRLTFSADEFDLPLSPINELTGGTPHENAIITKKILSGDVHGAKRNIVLLNTAAALIVGDAVDTTKDIGQQFKEGIGIAAKAIDSGKAMEVLKKLIA